MSKFKNWLLNPEVANEQSRSGKLEIASAVLMLEVCKADFDMSDDELVEIEQALIRRFGQSEPVVKDILRKACEKQEEYVSAHELIRTLNENLDPAEKCLLLEDLWRVAFVDGTIDKYEEYHIRKIADWLYLPHSDFIRTKHVVASELDSS